MDIDYDFFFKVSDIRFDFGLGFRYIQNGQISNHCHPYLHIEDLNRLKILKGKNNICILNVIFFYIQVDFKYLNKFYHLKIYLGLPSPLPLKKIFPCYLYIPV